MFLQLYRDDIPAAALWQKVTEGIATDLVVVTDAMRSTTATVDDVQALRGRLNFGVLGQQQDAHEGLVYMLDQGRRDAYQQQQGWTVPTMKPRFKQICTTCGDTNHVGEGGRVVACRSRHASDAWSRNALLGGAACWGTTPCVKYHQPRGLHCCLHCHGDCWEAVL